MALEWKSVGPWGHYATLPGGVIATVGATRDGFRWALSHQDLPVRASGFALTMAGARAGVVTAAQAFAVNLADALDARAAQLTARATACRNWTEP